MQKNVPKYTPDWVRTVDAVGRGVEPRRSRTRSATTARTLLWFANQRAVEYHPTLVLAERPDHMTHLVLDLDPPEATAFPMAVQAAHLVRRVARPTSASTAR